MAKTVSQRLKESFDDSNHDDIVKYMDWLRATMVDANQALQRTIAIALLLIAVFELVSESPNIRLTIGSFQVSKGSVVLVFIPALISYLYLQAIVASGRLQALQAAFTEACSKWSAKAEQNDLDVLVLPAQALYWNVLYKATRNITALSDSIEDAIIFILAIVVVLGVLGFEVQAYYKLYPKSITHNLLWLVSASVSLFCIIMAVIHFWTSKAE